MQGLQHWLVYRGELVNMLWFSTGLLGGIFAVLHRRHWALILLMVVAIDVATGILHPELGLDSALESTHLVGLFADPITALLFAISFQRLVPGMDPLGGLRSFGWYCLIPILLSTAVASFMSVCVLLLIEGGFPFSLIWQQWWFADTLGLLAIATPLIIVYTRWDRCNRANALKLEGIALLALFSGLIYVFLISPPDHIWFRHLQAMLTLPLFVWAVTRFGTIMISLMNSILILMVHLGLVMLTGPFKNQLSGDTRIVLQAQGVLIPITLTLMFVATIFECRRREYLKLLEAERRLWDMTRMEHLAMMAGGVTHDLGNLAISISAQVRTLRSLLPDSSESVRKVINGIDDVADGVQQLTRSMMTFAKQPVDDDLDTTEVSDLCAEVRDCVSSMEPLLAKRQRLELRVPETSIYVSVGPVKIMRILSNLVLNSGDASETGRVTYISVNEGVNEVQLAVSDRGHGIPDGAKEKIFETWYSTKSKNRGPGMGRGLGLSIVKDLTDQANGKIDLVSTEGVGTTITITLPKLHGYIPPERKAV